LWLGLAHAASGDDKAWVDLVVLATQQDGTGASAEELDRRAAPLCEHGNKAACSLAEWAAPFDRKAAVQALTPACDGGDHIACLVVGWDLSQVDWGVIAPQAANPSRALALFRQGCEAGVQRACTEVAAALATGTGTDVRRPEAMEIWKDACNAGEPKACREYGLRSIEPVRTQLLNRAADLGNASAHADLARDAQGEERVRRTVAACDLGLGAACRALARTDPDPLSRLQASCTAQSTNSCVLMLVGSAEWGGAAVSDVVQDLDHLCPREPEACARSALLSLGAPPVTFLDGVWPHGEAKRFAGDLRGLLFPCYVERITRGDVRGFVDASVQVDKQGRIAAAALQGPLVDSELSACVQQTAKGFRVRVPDGGSLLVPVSLGFDHTSDAKLHPSSTPDHPEDLTTFAQSLDGLEPTIDQCAVGAPVDVPTIGLDVVVSKAGSFDSVEVTHATGFPEIDRCVRDHLVAAELKPLGGKLKGVLTVDLLQPAVPSDPASVNTSVAPK
jgi:hypothetical protein